MELGIASEEGKAMKIIG